MVSRSYLRVVREGEHNLTGSTQAEPVVIPTAAFGRSGEVTVVKTIDPDLADPKLVTDVEDFYPAANETPGSRVAPTLALLKLASAQVDQAVGALRQSDEIAADDHILQLLGILEETFCLRDIGDGFASVINSCINAIRNLKGDFLTEQQILAVGVCLRTLRTRPFCNDEVALAFIERLMDAGLDVDSEPSEIIADWLAGESVR